jgi:hypothetical protein
MPTEVTVRIYDPQSRSADYWRELVEDLVESEDGEVFEVEDEEV